MCRRERKVTSKTMESVWNYYSTTKKVLSFIGQWPYQESRTRMFRMSLMTIISISLVIPQVGKLIHCDGDLRCISLTVPSLMFTIMILVKLYTCQFINSKMKILLDRLSSDWEKLKDLEEYEIMKTYAANARLFTLGYSLYCYIASASFLSVSLIPHILNFMFPLNESRTIFMPYEAYYFVDGEKYFFYIFIHAFVSIEINVAVLIAHDCMILICIEHVCSIFVVAGHRFENLSHNDHDDAVNNNLDDKYDRKITVSINAHWRAIQFAELLEKTFCIALAIQIMIVTVTMSISLLQVSLQLNNVMQTFKFTLFIIGQLFHIFCYSVEGQKLIDHSVQIRDKIYNSSWYDIPLKPQRLLLYVMQRSMRSHFLSAGKIYVFSLKSFTTVIQSSVSYFTVLASFQ